MTTFRRIPLRMEGADLLMIIVGCSLLMAAPTHADESPAIAIPGQYLDADSVKSGDGWWGLLQQGTSDQLTLEPTTVNMRPARNRFQGPTEEPSDVEFALPPNSSVPVIIVRGLTCLRPGRLKTAYWNYGRGEFLYPGQSKNITIEGEGTEMRFGVSAFGIAEEPTRESETRFRNYGLVLKRWSGEEILRQELLANLELGRYSFPQILWAGDLDRDGLPDLIVDQSTEEFKIHLVLYLSSKAGKGELVGRVVEWEARTDC